MPEPERTLTEDIEVAFDRVMGPPPDEVDEAIRVLTEARRVAKNPALMRAVRQRVREQRAAVTDGGRRASASGDGEDDA